MQKTIELNGGQAPWFSRESPNKTAKAIQFSAANGFPVASYQEFFDGFDQNNYSISGIDCRGTWLPKKTPSNAFSTEDFADDLISAIETQHSQPVIGIGHSHGGLVTIAAACKRPELFSTLIVIEGASLPNAWLSPIYRRIPKAILTRVFPFIKGSLERQSLWLNREAFYQRYYGHNTFKHFTDQSFSNYAQHGLRELDDGRYELVFDPVWEAHIFCRIKFLWEHLEPLRVPTLLIRGEHSYLYSQAQFERYNQRLSSNIRPVTMRNAHHLVPHEHPSQLTELVCHYLENPDSQVNMPHCA